jgi:hypothetical protein
LLPWKNALGKAVQPAFRAAALIINPRNEAKGMLPMNDNDEFAAAMLASALVEIQKGAVELEPDPVEAAAMMYFDCLDAIRAERIKRVARNRS